MLEQGHRLQQKQFLVGCWGWERLVLSPSAPPLAWEWSWLSHGCRNRGVGAASYSGKPDGAAANFPTLGISLGREPWPSCIPVPHGRQNRGLKGGGSSQPPKAIGHLVPHTSWKLELVGAAVLQGLMILPREGCWDWAWGSGHGNYDFRGGAEIPSIGFSPCWP